MTASRLTDYLDSLHTAGVPGCDLIVCRDHRVIYRHKAGVSDFAGQRPVRGDELYWLFSCTKVFTTCAAMQLVGQGKLNLDDPVSKWLPAYARLTVRDGDTVRPAKREMTVRHLMSMQSGLDYNLQRPAVVKLLKETDGKASTRQIAEAFALDPLCFDPGEDFLYSLSHDVLAAVIEVISGEKFSDYLKAHIWGPLGIRFSFTLLPEHLPRLCAGYWVNEEGRLMQAPADSNNYKLGVNHESGGAGLLGDAESYAAFADALACGGKTAGGQELLPPEMIQLWSANQLGPRARQTFDTWKRLGYSYALGVRTRVDNTLGGKGAVGEFGWDGAAGAWTMIDPDHHLSAFYAMHVRNFGYSYDVIHPTIRTLIYEELL